MRSCATVSQHRTRRQVLRPNRVVGCRARGFFCYLKAQAEREWHRQRDDDVRQYRQQEATEAVLDDYRLICNRQRPRALCSQRTSCPSRTQIVVKLAFSTSAATSAPRRSRKCESTHSLPLVYLSCGGYNYDSTECRR